MPAARGTYASVSNTGVIRDMTAEKIEPQPYARMAQWERRALRLRYIDDQEGLCWHCRGLLRDPPPQHVLDKAIDWRRFPGGREFLRHPVHLHHSHASGMTIGAVHAYCNAVLWQYHGE